MISRHMVATTAGLTEPQIWWLARFGSGHAQQLARKHERYPGLVSDVLTPDLQRGAYLRWSQRTGGIAR